MRKYGRLDLNHTEIVTGLRAIGATVHSMASMGSGFPDLLVGYRGQTFLIEVKSDGGKLTEAQKRWHGEWRGQVAVAYDLDDAMSICGVRK